MASKGASSRKGEAGGPRRSIRRKLVSALKSRALAVARKAITLKPRRPASGGSAEATSSRKPERPAPSTARHLTSATAPPVPRRSVVRKPPRAPSVRAVSTTGRGAVASVKAGAHRPEGAAPSMGHAATIPPTPPARATSTTAHRPSPETTSRQASASWRNVEEAFSIPRGYGDDRIVLMVKDPWWLYAYWEIQPSTERAVRGQLAPQEVAGLQTVLRVYDVTGLESPDDGAHRSFDIPLSGLATNWYIHTNAPTRSFVVEIGLLTAGGRFLRLARSNRVTSPRAGPSDVVDETWMTTDEEFWKLLGRSTGLGIGSSPGRIEWLPQQLFSGAWSSPTVFGPHRRAAVRGFWYRVNTDLVIHGATEPRATVTVQGHPVTVRKDGTFSLRLALPEGTQTVTIDVASPDGQHTRTVSQVVSLALSGPLTASETTQAKRQVARSRPTARGRPAPGVASEPR